MSNGLLDHKDIYVSSVFPKLRIDLKDIFEF